MTSINKAIIIGRLGKDPQINTFTNGGKIRDLTREEQIQWLKQQKERER